MTWLLIGALIWVVLAIPLAMLIGRSIRQAEDRKATTPADSPQGNFVASDMPPGDVQPAESPEPWTGPATVPFAPSRRPEGGDRTAIRRSRPPVVRHAIRPVDRDPNARDSGHS